uniref:uncharacterized protein LOC101296822 isoform X1 n=1 Tax=Fragaria vesca subsp. vesca TaxID=101020 RepID=UPI0005CB1911|nr:PREDICTED: uncharacterized protein LOC101296822 isoform X1 [Fragaria vesca subsp. vesca]
MDPQNPAEKRSSLRNDKQSSIAKNKSSKVTLQDIQVVQNLIERCLQLYMSRDEVVNTLLDRARIEPEFTNLVWQKLEEENAKFFKAYHLRLKLKDQIEMYNQLLEKQYHLMKQQERAEFERAPVQNGMHHIPVNNLSVEYPIMQTVTPSTGYPKINYMGISGCHGVNGIPALGNFHHIQQKCAKEGPADTVPFFPAGDMKLVGDSSPVASNGQFPFTPETSGLDLDLDTPALDSAFTSDIADLDLERMRLGVDSQNTCPESLQPSWDFGFSNTTEWPNFQDFGPVGNCSGSKFQHSELDINLDSAEHNDMADAFLLVDGPPGQGTQLEESKPK